MTCGECKYFDKDGECFKSSMSGYTTEEKQCLAPVPHYLVEWIENSETWWVSGKLEENWVYPTDQADECACYAPIKE